MPDLTWLIPFAITLAFVLAIWLHKREAKRAEREAMLQRARWNNEEP